MPWYPQLLCIKQAIQDQKQAVKICYRAPLHIFCFVTIFWTLIDFNNI